MRDHYYDRKKKRYSRLSGGCILVITTGKKSSCHLSGGCAIIITTGKKNISSRLSGGCAIVIMTGKKSSSRDFYVKLNVSNLNVTNLYYFF